MAVINALNINFLPNQLLYATGANALAGLVTANNSVLITSGAGVPSLSATLPLAVQSNITQLGTITAGVWNGTIIDPTFGGTGANNGANILSLAGSLTTAGAFAVNFTFTAATAVTFPTAGTLATTAGTVASVSGTLNRITSTGGVNPIIDIDAAYIGQASITTLGTIVTGVWNGTDIALADGGTNASLVASNGGIVWSNATQMQILAGTATARQMLQSGATATPAWSTATWPATTTINQILYSSANNVVNEIVTGNNGLLVTGNTGIPTILAGPGTTGQILQANAAAAPSFSTASYPSSTTINRILFSSANNVVDQIATANSGTLATSSAGVPSIVALGAGQVLVGVSGATPAAGSIPGVNMLINGDFQVWQRGAGGSATFAVPAVTTAQNIADRWQITTAANQASTVTQTAGATSGSFTAKVQRNNLQTGVGAVIYIVQSMTRDMCLGAAGNVLTLSFKAKAGANFSAASSQLTVAVVTGTGTTDTSVLNGGWTGQATVLSLAPTITTTLTQFSGTTSTLGATVTQVAVEIGFLPVGTAGADDSFQVTDVQIEISPVVSPYDRKSFFDTWTKCQRFYQKTFAYATLPAQGIGANNGELQTAINSAAATTNFIGFNMFPQMRTTPTVTTFSPGAASAEVYNISAAAVHTATTTTNITSHSVRISSTGNAGGTTAQCQGVHVTLEAEVA